MLPKPTATLVPSGKEVRDFTPEDLRGLYSNPIYTGIGPYPRIYSDEEWIKVALIQINHEGAVQFLVNMLSVLRKSFEAEED